MDHQGILCVVTGMEKSGTTFLSKLLASNPDIMCGFECGLLLSDISDFDRVQPFFRWMGRSTTIGHWGILPENLAEVCESETFEDAYRRIHRHAGDRGSRKLKNCFRHATWIVDKTPRYVFELEAVMAKIDVPFIVIEKDIADQYLSFRRQGVPMEEFIAAWCIYARQLRFAQQRFPHRLRIVRFRELLRDQAGTMRKIYRFLGIPYYAETGLDRFYERTGLPKHGGLRSRFRAGEEGAGPSVWEVRTVEALERMPAPVLRGISTGMRFWIAAKVLARKSLDVLGIDYPRLRSPGDR